MHKHIITREEYSTRGKVLSLLNDEVYTSLCGCKIEKHKYDLWQIYNSRGEPFFSDGPATCEACILLYWIERNENCSFS